MRNHEGEYDSCQQPAVCAKLLRLERRKSEHRDEQHGMHEHGQQCSVHEGSLTDDATQQSNGHWRTAFGCGLFSYE
ncbi:hypothetical protein D3C84_1206320 [compost metagenome]